MPSPDFLTAPRAAAVRFELPPPHAGEVVIPAPSLGQVADCLRLDPRTGAEPETARERILRLQRQAKILLGREHAHLTAVLTMGQVTVAVQALYLAAAGIDPTDFVAAQASLQRTRTDPRGAEELLADIDRLTVELAAELRITPAEAAKMPVADAISLRAKLAANAHAEARFVAAVHGRTLG